MIAHIEHGVNEWGAMTELPDIPHTFTHFRLTLKITQLSVTRIAPRAMQPGAMWIARDDLAKAALPKPMSRLLASF